MYASLSEITSMDKMYLIGEFKKKSFQSKLNRGITQKRNVKG